MRQELTGILRTLRERTATDPEVTEAVLRRAAALLRLLARRDPGALERARKPEAWAAGALHAAVRGLGFAVRGMTAEEVATRFDVAPGTVSERSVALRRAARDVRIAAKPDELEPTLFPGTGLTDVERWLVDELTRRDRLASLRPGAQPPGPASTLTGARRSRGQLSLF